MKPTKEQLTELINDYAAAKVSGSVNLIKFAIVRIEQAVDALYREAPKPEDAAEKSVEKPHSK